MRRVLTLFSTSIGKKAVMAVTGFILVGFIVLHVHGNLKIFYGAEKMDAYSAFLREVGEPVFGYGEILWIVRAVLLLSVLLHIWAAVSLTRMSMAARPVSYKQEPHLESSYASRTMRWGGVILALFVVYHILHMTTGDAHPAFVHGEVFNNFVIGFSSWPVVAVYTLAVGALSFHLHHGIWSALQTLGANHPKYNRLRKTVSAALAVLVFLGFMAGPVAVVTGFVR